MKRLHTTTLIISASTALLVAPFRLQALDPHKALTLYSRTTWTQADGLPEDSIRRIAQTLNQWFCIACFSQPAAFTYGTAGRNLPNVRSHDINNFDVSLVKNTRFGREEQYNIQFRSEFFNAANRVRFSAPGGQIGNATFGVVSGQANNPRQIQLSMRVLF